MLMAVSVLRTFLENLGARQGEFKNLAQLYVVVNLKRVATNKVRNYGKKLHLDFSS